MHDKSRDHSSLRLTRTAGGAARLDSGFAVLRPEVYILGAVTQLMTPDGISIEFREFPFGSDEYHKEKELRDAVLRQPIGLRLSEADCQGEPLQRHFGLFDSHQTLLACALAVPLDSSQVKIRQMAVRREFQGQGLGRRLFQSLEPLLAGEGFTVLTLHARMSALGFYEALGFAKVGGEFLEVGLPHLKMRKEIR